MRNVKSIRVGGLVLGGSRERVFVQSMLSVGASDVGANVEQAVLLERAGCEILRVAVPSLSDVGLISAIKNNISIPLVADIHFDYKIALECINAGVDKIRINPGNIGGLDKIKLVADSCRVKSIPIRIGINSGSLEKDILGKYGEPTAEALVESAMRNIALLERCDFSDIVVSIKSSCVKTMVAGYRLLAEKCDYPLHLGVTEAGTMRQGLIKSSIGIGALLLDGIGETIRVSLTADPTAEIQAAADLLKAIGLRAGINIISCPTCGRCQIDVISLAERVEQFVTDKNIDKDMTVAIMGCVVNGPGEAKGADVGIAGGRGEAVLFKKGEIVCKIREDEIYSALIGEIKKG